jgi:hypothetical protein
VAAVAVLTVLAVRQAPAAVRQVRDHLVSQVATRIKTLAAVAVAAVLQVGVVALVVPGS